MVAVALTAAAVAQQAGSIRGSVQDREFNAPVAEAQVSVVETGQRATTDDQGAFAIPNLRPGKYTLVVAKEGYVRHVRGDLVVVAGQLTELSVQLAGDFTDLEPFVVTDVLRLGAEGEAALLDVRLESPALVNTISADLMSKAGASDAAGALRLVSGASLQGGKSAVIRGLPDRYVSSQMNGVRLPSADEDKRAVELDQFPTDVISSIQVSKTFTPDQQGDASGGAVDVRLRGVPDQPFLFRWRLQTSNNSQVTGRSRFLTYEDGGLNYWGGAAAPRGPQSEGGNWDGAVGVDEADAPIDYKWAGSVGGRFEIARGVRIGGTANLFYERDSGYFDNGVEDAWRAEVLREPLTPDVSQGSPGQPFLTSLFDVEQGRQTVQWGGLGTIGIETDDHAVTAAYLFTRTSDDIATRAEDTRGKHYFYPGHDPDDPLTPGHDSALLSAPYLRFQTLEYTERLTSTLQFTGRHKLPVLATSRKMPSELDWTIARSTADRDQPDKRQFSTAWYPIGGGFYEQVRPAATFSLGNLQRTYFRTEEDSELYSVNWKVPFRAWNGEKGYAKVGVFRDKVNRKFDQDTYSNFFDPIQGYSGAFDQLDWSDVWQFEDHAISSADTDIDYVARQRIESSYVMVDLPLHKSTSVIAGVRWEATGIDVVVDPEDAATWLPEGQFSPTALEPGDADVKFRQRDVLPAIAVVNRSVAGLTLRASYSETVARQTFKELTPILQQKYLGGPIFIGNPELRMSNLRNYDLRADYVPREGSLFSLSWFRKDIDNPIEYVEKAASFNYTTASNYPRGKLQGIELEARQALGPFVDALDGLAIGGNITWIKGKVRLPESEILLFEQTHGERPDPIRDMTSTPDYIYNLFLTYDIEATRTQLGVFYTVQGDTLVTQPGPSNSYYIPPTYQPWVDYLAATLVQRLGDHMTLTIAAKNLTNNDNEQVYRSEYQEAETLRRRRTEGVEFSFTLGGQYTF